MVVYAFGLLPEMKEAHFFERHRLRRETEDRSSVSLLRRCLSRGRRDLQQAAETTTKSSPR